MKNEKDIKEILKNAPSFVAKVVDKLREDNLHVENLVIDHICYKVETYKRYDELKAQFATVGQLLGGEEKMIGGRPISTYKLENPIRYDWRDIYCIELPAPSPDKKKHHPEGFEHAEFVLKQSFSSFMRRYDHIKFDTSGLAKEHNRDIKIQYQDFAVKFHRKPIDKIIEEEQNSLYKI